MVVIGIGSPVLTDGGAPLSVIELLRSWGNTAGTAHFAQLPAGGIDLLDELEGYSRAIIIAAFPQHDGDGVTVTETVMKDAPPGADIVTALPGDHGVEVQDVLALGKRCGYTVPDTVVLLGIHGTDVYTIGEQLSTAMPDVVKKVAQRVENLQEQWTAR